MGQAARILPCSWKVPCALFSMEPSKRQAPGGGQLHALHGALWCLCGALVGAERAGVRFYVLLCHLRAVGCYGALVNGIVKLSR